MSRVIAIQSAARVNIFGSVSILKKIFRVLLLFFQKISYIFFFFKIKLHILIQRYAMFASLLSFSPQSSQKERGMKTLFIIRSDNRRI